MNILHVHDEADCMAARYVALLTKAVGNRATMRSATSADAFRRLAAEGADIVHLHGHPPFSVPRNHRLVLTPHGQPAVAGRYYVVVARSQMERDTLQPHFERIEVVRNPIITRTTSADACAGQMLAIYRRIMDSNVQQLMDADTRQALAMVLAAAIGGDHRWVDARFPAAVNFRQLYTYADHEGVLHLVETGLATLGVEAPRREPVECYMPDGYSRPVPMPGADVAALLADVANNGPSLLRLCELTAALRSDSLDEAQLMARLKEQRQAALLPPVLQLLSEQTLLTEGFMPCPPADNRLTQQLRTRLTERHNIMA